MLNSLKRTFGFINQHPLAKKNLIRAYFNFIKWQFISRLNDHLVQIPFIENVSFYAKKRLTGITGNIYTGLHEFNDMGFLLHFLRKDDSFYDVGANVGSYTLLASGICGARTLAFEPIIAAFNILTKNVELNKLELLVTLENKGVGNKSGELNFTTDSDTTNHVLTTNDLLEKSVKVPVVTLDFYNKQHIPILIKIDVEGYEAQVLEGAQILLSNPNLKAIIIEVIGGAYSYGLSNSDIHEMLMLHNFMPYHYDPFTRKLTQISQNSNCNTIYIRDIDFVLQRVKSAKHFRIFNQRI